MKRTLTAITAAALITLTGCGTNVEKDATYETGADLAKAINTVGDFGCDTEPLEDLYYKHDWLGISCDTSTAALYSSEMKRKEIYRKNPLDPGEARLAGPNWSYTDELANVKAVQEVLGGSIEPAMQNTPTVQPIEPAFEEGFKISCRDDSRGESVEFDSFEDAWELDPAERDFCLSSWKHSPESEAAELHNYTDTELEALEVSGYDDQSDLQYLHGKCAQAYLGKDDEHYIELGEDGLAEFNGALTLCPDHPEREEAERRIAESADVHEQRENGTRFAGGPHRVGDDIQPGTYVVEDEEGFDGCYWERLNASGSIIQNNFMRSGFRAEVTIAASDYSFSSEGCGEWVQQ